MSAVIATSTAAAYRAMPATADLENDVDVSWQIPTSRVAGKTIVDAAYDDTSGRTYMIASEGGDYQAGGIYVAASPGATPQQQALPGITATYRVHHLAMETRQRKLVAVIRAGSQFDVTWLLSFVVGPTGALTLSVEEPLIMTADARVLALDVMNSYIAILILRENSSVGVEWRHISYSGVKSKYLCFLPASDITDISFLGYQAGYGQRLMVGTKGGTYSCPESPDFWVGPADQIEGTATEHAFRVRDHYVERLSGEDLQVSGYQYVIQGPAPVIAVDRKTGVAFSSYVGRAYVRELREPATEANTNLAGREFAMRGNVSDLLTSYGAALVLFKDGSVGWMLS
ncbi:hypothetical protein HCX50_04030 [Microbacterium oxydans]|uniref:hypothetical protein n=1 Tax=Microbacterium sp. B19(2022) TaxID=2914045 RepID=UPI001430360A|nr:hypothetical protein [Microbacterium sp. B19(2022)]NJI58595.1 hypothetical protein [Microbacterium sp. B19(2022)]